MRRFSLLGILTFLILFVYFYKTSGKFRVALVSAQAAFAIANPFASPPPANADGFCPKLPERQRARTNRKLPIQGAKKPKNNGSDGGGNDDNGMPEYPKPESVQETEKRLENIDEYISRMEESSDSEEEQCEATKQVDESYKSNSDLKKITENAEKSKRAVKNLEDVKQKLSEGADPMKIGRKPTNLGNNFYYIRKSHARIIVKLDRTTGNSDVIAFALRSNTKNIETFATVVNSQYDTKNKIDPNAY